jgi:hypothetical protein
MRRNSSSTRLHIVFLLVLLAINVPPWLVFKGNRIAAVCAFEIPSPPGTPQTNFGHIVHDTPADQEAVAGSTGQAVFVVDPIDDVEMNEDEEQSTPYAAHVNDENTVSLGGSPLNPSTEAGLPSSPPSTTARRQRSNTYYVRLSALPGTEDAREQHLTVTEALLSLPDSKVTIRHEFGMDDDDVLNVISFKLEGSGDGLEEIAAMEGVIGIYPVVRLFP